jgi:hypothetical protein
MKDDNYIRIKAFNEILKGMIDFLCEKFSNDRDLNYTQSEIELSMKTTSMTPMLSFMEGLEPHKKEIDDKNEVFFSNLSETGFVDLHDKWNLLDANEKEQMWKYITKLRRIGEMCGL